MRFVWWNVCAGVCLFLNTAEAADIERLKRIWLRLAGVPATPAELTLISGKSEREVADLALQRDSFVNITAKHLFCPMSNRPEEYLVARSGAVAGAGCLNDFVATGMGVVRDNRSAKLLLTGDFIYRADPALVPTASGGIPIHTDTELYATNQHYDRIEAEGINFAQVLIPSPQMHYTAAGAATPVLHPDPAGLITSRQFAREHMTAGTNRRVFEYAVREFLCEEIGELRDSRFQNDPVKVTYIRRDVDKTNRDFLSTCITCHGGLDRVSTAFAYYNFENGKMVYTGSAGTVQQKMNPTITDQNQGGYNVTSDEWENYFVDGRNQRFGWKGSLRGRGAKEFGEMLANTSAFPACMAKRVFKEVCRRSPAASEAPVIDALAQGFEQNGYQFRYLFRETSLLPRCVGN